MSDLTKATLVIEEAITFGDGLRMRPAVRVIPHDEEGKKPRGKKGSGLLIVAHEGETHADVLRTVAAYLEQEGHDWQALAPERTGR
jgi:hypothetical protein